MGSIEIYDIAEDLYFTGPSVPERFIFFGGGLNNSDRVTSLSHGDRISTLLNFVEQAEAFGFELRCANRSRLHRTFRLALTWSSDQFRFKAPP